MKKSLLFVAVASLFALASCGGEKQPETSTVDTVAVATVDSSAAVTDTAAAAETTATDTASTVK